jgi:hypothetical protein
LDEVLQDAAAVDAEEDGRFGDRRGDELPAELATAQGRRGWLREAKRRLDEQRAAEARPIPRSRPERLAESKRRLEEQHQVECQANADYEAYRARSHEERPPLRQAAYALHAAGDTAGEGQRHRPGLAGRQDAARLGQGYNAQAVCNERQTDTGRDIYSKRQGTIEPIFANTTFNRRIDRFLRRGRAACRSEWRLITATRNLLKLHHHGKRERGVTTHRRSTGFCLEAGALASGNGR